MLFLRHTEFEIGRTVEPQGHAQKNRLKYRLEWGICPLKKIVKMIMNLLVDCYKCKQTHVGVTALAAMMLEPPFIADQKTVSVSNPTKEMVSSFPMSYRPCLAWL